MPIDFYYFSASVPCRGAMLTASALGLELNKKVLNLREKDQLKPEFVKLNPQHCIPTMDDDGFILWESRAISVYLATKYGKDDSLYPNDPQIRGLVQQRLNFDQGTLYQRFHQTYLSVMMGREDKVDPEKVKSLKEAVDWLDGFLANNKWAAADHVTVADHSLAATIGSIEGVGFDLSPYKNVSKWYKQCQDQMPGFKEANQEGIDVLSAYAQKILEGKQ